MAAAGLRRRGKYSAGVLRVVCITRVVTLLRPAWRAASAAYEGRIAEQGNPEKYKSPESDRTRAFLSAVLEAR